MEEVVEVERGGFGLRLLVLAHLLLQPLPAQRTCDYEETRVYVTTTCGFVLRKVF